MWRCASMNPGWTMPPPASRTRAARHRGSSAASGPTATIVWPRTATAPAVYTVRRASRVSTSPPFTRRSQASGVVVIAWRGARSAGRSRRGIPAPALDHVHVELDAEPRALGRIREAALDPERWRQEVLGVIEDAAGVAVGPEVRHGEAQVDLGRGADPELRHAADHARQAGRLAEGEDPARVEEPARLGDVDVDDVGGAAPDDLHGVARRADALV